MADDMDFESFENLDDLDWSELEQDIQDGKEAEPSPIGGGDEDAAPAAPKRTPRPAAADAVGNVDISYLLDVDLKLTVEVGKAETYISEVLTWDRGSIIELSKVVGQPLNLVINKKPVARGEVVVVNEKFALKITEILDPKDRLNAIT